ncbi:MAG: hypothetical protein RPU52_02480 [Candidatus Sedimenticola sp. (ex Thyasira tokunagai)]
MTDLISTLGSLVASLGNVQSADVLRERVALISDQLELLKQRVIDLEEENTGFMKENDKLKQEIARQLVSEEYVEHRGALFKRKPSGGYAETPVCPVCRRSMWCFQKSLPYECSDDACRHPADFTGRDLPGILAALDEE